MPPKRKRERQGPAPTTTTKVFVKHLQGTKELDIPDLSLTENSDFYPGLLFEHIPLAIAKGLSLKKMAAVIYSNLTSDEMRESHITAFLLGFGLQKMVEDPAVYGIELDKANVLDENGKFSPFMVFAPVMTKEIFVEGTGDLPEGAMEGLVLGIAYAHKISKVQDDSTHASYRNELYIRYNKLKETAPFSGGPDLQNLSHFVSLCGGDEVRKVLSLIDYFLVTVQDSPLGLIRTGSCVTRYDGMSILNDIEGAKKLLSIKASELAYFIQHPEGISEMQAILDHLHGTLPTVGLFPYQSSLGLVRKCGYSVGQNPYLHTFFNMIGCIMKSKRSYNTRCTDDANAGDATMHALLLCKIAGYASSGRVFFSTKEDADGADDGGIESLESKAAKMSGVLSQDIDLHKMISTVGLTKIHGARPDTHAAKLNEYIADSAGSEPYDDVVFA